MDRRIDFSGLFKCSLPGISAAICSDYSRFQYEHQAKHGLSNELWPIRGSSGLSMPSYCTKYLGLKHLHEKGDAGKAHRDHTLPRTVFPSLIAKDLLTKDRKPDLLPCSENFT